MLLFYLFLFTYYISSLPVLYVSNALVRSILIGDEEDMY